eukprot:1666205-Pyramimonas_sp.AAC.2
MTELRWIAGRHIGSCMAHSLTVARSSYIHPPSAAARRTARVLGMMSTTLRYVSRVPFVRGAAVIIIGVLVKRRVAL